MELIGTYKIKDEQITNPIFKYITHDDDEEKKADVELIFSFVNTSYKITMNLPFTYVDSWEDTDIQNFIVNELEKLKC